MAAAAVAALFSEWTHSTFTLQTNDVVQVAEGSLQWPALLNSTTSEALAGPRSLFAVYRALITPDTVEAALQILRGDNLPLSTQPDTVDSMATFELYWLSPKPVHPVQRPVTDRLTALLRPIIDERITPIVNQRYQRQCRGGCTPCTSLVRRYRPDERRSHGEHFDLQALATAVVSLSTYGVDYPHGSGLYVSTGAELRVLGLSAGDVVIHQSDLLHGVAMAEEEEADLAERAEASWERWSWIVWYSDSATCEERGHLWNRKAAEANDDALASFLHAKRVHLDPSLTPLVAQQQRVRFLTQSAEAGFSRAMVDLGMAHKRGDEGVEKDLVQAARWWRRANASADSSLASFNFGQLLLESADEIADELAPEERADPVAAAVRMFFAAVSGGEGAHLSASPGHALAYHNLGVAHRWGRSVPQDDGLAATYFGRAGSAVAMRLAAEIHSECGRIGTALRWMRRAANAGDDEARRLYPVLRRRAQAAAAERARSHDEL